MAVPRKKVVVVVVAAVVVAAVPTYHIPTCTIVVPAVAAVVGSTEAVVRAVGNTEGGKVTAAAPGGAAGATTMHTVNEDSRNVCLHERRLCFRRYGRDRRPLQLASRPRKARRIHRVRNAPREK